MYILACMHVVPSVWVRNSGIFFFDLRHIVYTSTRLVFVICILTVCLFYSTSYNFCLLANGNGEIPHHHATWPGSSLPINYRNLWTGLEVHVHVERVPPFYSCLEPTEGVSIFNVIWKYISKLVINLFVLVYYQIHTVHVHMYVTMKPVN